MVNRAIWASVVKFKVALLTFLLGITAVAIWVALTRDKREPRVIIPDRLGPQAFKILDERASVAKLPTLRTVLLPANDLEVRVWVGGGTHGDDGLVLRKSAGQWSAMYLEGMFDKYPPARYQETHILPGTKSGWNAAWQRLIKTGIMSLPDESATRCETSMVVVDGTDYVVEINANEIYRVYSYSNPNYAPCAEAAQILEIGEIVAEEFGLKSFNLRK